MTFLYCYVLCKGKGIDMAAQPDFRRIVWLQRSVHELLKLTIIFHKPLKLPDRLGEFRIFNLGTPGDCSEVWLKVNHRLTQSQQFMD
jgi:hypothetical protein